MSFLNRPYKTLALIMAIAMMIGGARTAHAQLSVIGRTFELQNTTGTNSIQLIAPSVSASYTLSMPSAQGASSSVLTNDGTGALSWGSLSSTVWSLTGNSISSSSGALSASPTGSFLGTTGAYDLRLVTDNTVRMIVSSTGAISLEKDATINGVTIGKGGGGVASNVAVGTSALSSNLSSGGGSLATAVGYQALMGNTEGLNVTAVGARSLEANTTGSNNTAIGGSTLRSNTTGARNTAVGLDAGRTLIDGSGNVFVGYQAGYNEAGSSKLYIANASNVAGTLIYGSFDNRTIVINPETPVFPATSPPDPSGALQVNAPTSSTKGFIVKAASSQSANLVEVQNSSGAARLTVNSTGNLVLSPTGTSAGNTNEVRFEELAANGSNYVSVKAPDALGSNVAFVLPSSAGTSGQFLATDGSGTLSWTSGVSASTAWVLAGNSSSDSTSAYLGTTDGRPLVVKTNGTERVRVFATGQVGIGTSTPTKTLDVAGTLGTSGLVTSSAGVNLSGATSPFQLDGSAGTSGYVVTSKGAGATPEWKSALAALGIKAKGITALQTEQWSVEVAVDGLDANDVIIVTFEGDTDSANVGYYITRTTSGTTKFTLYFDATFTGKINYLVMD